MKPPDWRLHVRIRGHWTVCGLHSSSPAALREGLRQLTLAGELDLVTRDRSVFACDHLEAWQARLKPGAASFRVEEVTA